MNNAQFAIYVTSMDLRDIQKLFNDYGVSPRHEQGQNFLLDESIPQQMIDTAGITSDSTVLEIGPGFGMLTKYLVGTGARVVAIEQDRDLMPFLNKFAKQHQNFTVHNVDVREARLEEMGLHDQEYALVANLPYSVTSWILHHFLEYEPRPHTLVVMVQKEVAERVIAAPGEMSVLSVAVQALCEAEIVCIVPPESFHPAPKVDSAVLKMVLRPQPLTQDMPALMRLVKVGFASRRKQLHNNLQAGLQLTPREAKCVLEDIGLSEFARPQDLSVEDWEALRKALKR